MTTRNEKIALIITRARLMAKLKRFAFCRDFAGVRIHEGHILGCWYNGDSISNSYFHGASFQMFFVCFSERRKYFAGISTEAHWICMPIGRLWGKCFVAGNVFDDFAGYADYLSHFFANEK